MRSTALFKLALVSAGIATAGARRQHNAHTEKHGHTYLYLCADDADVVGNVCLHHVKNKWPKSALMDKSDCKEAASPYAAIGTTVATCSSTPTNKDWYNPITIPLGLVSPNVDYRTGADVDRFSDWDRIRCRDGQLFATGWYRKYTPHECARLCSKIKNFYGKSCTHFTRQWITTDIPEHDDSCGRDGDTGVISPTFASAAKYGSYGSAGTGGGSYKYRGQCIFFNSPNDECCATKAAWREAGVSGPSPDMDDNYCQAKYGDRQDAWNSKHRSWRKMPSSTFTPSSAWPVASLGRRLSAERPKGLDGESPGVHELIFANGTTAWSLEEADPF